MLAAPRPLAALASDRLTPDVEAEFALPVVQDFVGSVQCCWGPAGVQNWVVPPTGLPTPTGRLYAVDDAGRAAPVDPAGTAYQVLPWEIRRRHPVVDARTRLHAGDLTERLTFRRAGRYRLVFGGLCRTWSFAGYWNLPPDDVPQLNVRWDGEAVVVGDNKTFGYARFFLPRGARVRLHERYGDVLSGHAVAGLAGLTGAGRYASVEVDVAAGEEVAWTAAQGTEPGLRPAGDDADAQERWEEVWRAAFTPGNDVFSGHLPALDLGDDALNRLYDAGVLALLNGRRTPRRPGPRARYATGGQAIWASDATPLPVAYTTGATEGAATTSFLWELHLCAPLLARLDPDVLRRQLEVFLRADTDHHWGVDIATGAGVGMGYGINDGAIVTAAAAYLTTTGDEAWLDTTVGGRTVREHLLHHVDRHASLCPPGSVLADYGEAHHVLECVSSYEHGIASFNALAAWCHRFAADVLAPGRAAALRERADAIEAAVRGRLRPDGVFTCVTPDGERVVRTALDFLYVGRYLADQLDEDERARMLAFFTRELETVDWMRALSPADADSLTRVLPEFQTFRADHQSTGSYDGWPGLAADVRLRFGDGPATIAWLRRIAAVTREGPFGQAHWVGVPRPGEAAPPVRKASFFNGNCYLLVSGCTLSQALLEHATVRDEAGVRPVPEPIAAAVRAHGLAGPGAVTGVPVAGGVSCDVWRVDLAGGPVCAKRALPELKVTGTWRVPTARAASEAAWLRLAAEVAPGAACGLRAYDEASHVLVLDWLDPATHPLWKAQLLAGEVSVPTATAVGDRLGRLHAGAARADVAAWEPARPLFAALRTEPYLRVTARRRPEVADRLTALADALDVAAVTVVHGDVSPKNVLVGPDGPVLLDAECASPGDPAFDLAFCLNHLLIKAVHLPASAAELLAAARALAAAYAARVDWEPAADVLARTAALLPALALARVDGLSPVEYLTAAGRSELRSRALRLLTDPPDDLATVFDRWSPDA